MIREYWHAGHVQAVALHDVDRDGTPELLLGGVSNARRQATLVAIDLHATNGAARGDNPDYQFQGFPPAFERRRMYFPRATISDTDPYNRTSRIDVQADGVTIHVDEQLGSQPSTVFYRLTNCLSLRDLTVSDVFATRTRARGIDLNRENTLLRAITRQ